MQRWIALAVVALVLLGVGGYYGREVYRQNRPHSMWVPIEIREGASPESVDAMVKQIKTKLTQEDVLAGVCKDMHLRDEWKLSSDELAAQELKKRMFVKTGDMQSELGPVPAIHVGIRGKVKDSNLSGEIAKRMMKDVVPILHRQASGH